VSGPGRIFRRALRRPDPAACTIVTRNFLSYARIVGRSYLQHHPGSRFYALVVDGLPEDVEAGGGIEVVTPDALELPYLHELCFKYTVVELSTAVKPSFLAYLMEREESIVYLDPDILVMRRFVELWRELDSAPIVLTPHLLKPIPLDGLRPNEQDMLISGAYNLGFLAIRRSRDVDELLAWWATRLRDGCRIDVPHGLFTDQKWIDLVPCYFESAAALRDPTYNVAFWNLHERRLERRGSAFFAEGRPIAFFHFSGFTPTIPSTLSKHQTRTQVEKQTPLAELLNLYVDLHMRNGYARCSQWEYGYGRFDNGVRLNKALRQLYLNLDEELRQRFGNPFETHGEDSFLEWATRPRPDGLSRFLESLYRIREDVAKAFPDMRGADRDASTEWARLQGSGEMGYEPELVRTADRDELASRNGNGSKPEPYAELVRRIRSVTKTLPKGSTVAVVSKGDEELLSLGSRRGWHFPRTEDGRYVGYHPKSNEVAIAHLEEMRADGADFLLLPSTAYWWLDYYGGFREHLDGNYRRIWFDDACVIYELSSRAAAS
jgi:hypothetical protein